ncbi:hypothetical protein NKG94_40110 [Micromonospora sp. M12]
MSAARGPRDEFPAAPNATVATPSGRRPGAARLGGTVGSMTDQQPVRRAHAGTALAGGDDAGTALAGGDDAGHALGVDDADQVSAGPDRATLRLALVVGGLVLAVLLGFGLGRMNTNGAAAGSPSLAADHTDPPGIGPHSHGSATSTDQGASTEPGGLAVSSAGLTLAPWKPGSWPVAPVNSAFRYATRSAGRSPGSRSCTTSRCTSSSSGGT